MRCTEGLGRWEEEEVGGRGGTDLGRGPLGHVLEGGGDIAQGCSMMPDHWLRTLPYNE